MEKKILYHYKTREVYESEKDDISTDAIVFVKSDRSIITHGTEYCNLASSVCYITGRHNPTDYEITYSDFENSDLGDFKINAATTTTAGVMTAADKKKLVGMLPYFSLWQNSTRNITVGNNSVTISGNGMTIALNDGGTSLYYVAYVSGTDTSQSFVMSSVPTVTRKYYLLDTSVLQAGKRVAFKTAIKEYTNDTWMGNPSMVLLCSFYNGELDTDCGLMANAILGAKIKALE